MGNPIASKRRKDEKTNFVLHPTYPEILRATSHRKKKWKGRNSEKIWSPMQCNTKFLFSSFRLFNTKSRREEFRQVARLPADGIRSDARGEVK
jgi:hypothetical protein